MKKLLTITVWTLTGALFGALVTACIHWFIPINQKVLVANVLGFAWILGTLSVGLAFSKISHDAAKRILVESLLIMFVGIFAILWHS